MSKLAERETQAAEVTERDAIVETSCSSASAGSGMAAISTLTASTLGRRLPSSGRGGAGHGVGGHVRRFDDLGEPRPGHQVGVPELVGALRQQELRRAVGQRGEDRPAAAVMDGEIGVAEGGGLVDEGLDTDVPRHRSEGRAVGRAEREQDVDVEPAESLDDGPERLVRRDDRAEGQVDERPVALPDPWRQDGVGLGERDRSQRDPRRVGEERWLLQGRGKMST